MENITLVDTPGVLSGEMQEHQRAYHFADVSYAEHECNEPVCVGYRCKS